MELPDFLIIGTMKSGSTSFFEWLCSHPDVWRPGTKEPDFFANAERWARGLEWYSSFFAGRPPGMLTGEASPTYTGPDEADTAAERIRSTLPDVRLLCVLRNPSDRARSHYRHELQRGREKRTLTDAATSDSPYVRWSLYADCLAPYLRRFKRDQLLVVTLEGLTHDDRWWAQVLGHLGLRDIPRPDERYHVTESKQPFSRIGLALWNHKIRYPKFLPKRIRKLGKRLYISRDPNYEVLLNQSHGALPPHVEDQLWNNVGTLEAQLGVPQLWKR